MENVIENFFGCYLLYNINIKYKGKVYIGFTNDPNKRIIQHNKGIDFGGAKKTNNKGPWEMVLIVFGFPNKISALKFEWAWQNPLNSRALKVLNLVKNKREKLYDYNIRVFGHMLNQPPWKRLPLNVCWLKENYKVEFDSNSAPPLHIPIIQGPVISNKQNFKDSLNISSHSDLVLCFLCKQKISSDNKVECIIPDCDCVNHLTCLSTYFLKNNEIEIIPIEGSCPSCKTSMLWGDLIRFKFGYLRNINFDIDGPLIK
ncbi:unnamed protein product [Gordionus sp. m RMFG-2023]|uniref:structure-specific endonuclease subunit slx1-like n=1 Tax=Gordionus sp. m RMFG-2023 TaxID=3053472 RepID=UPI0030E138C2